MVTKEAAAPDGSPQWLKDRRRGIGGSDAAALFGCHPWMSPWMLYMDKTVGLPAKDYNAALEVGHALEPLTRRLFSEDSGRIVRPSSHTYIPEGYPWMRGNIDGDVERDDMPGPGVFEGKTTNPYARRDWETEGAPLYYLVQVHHYMVCTGRDWASIAVLVLGSKDPLLWQDIELDREFADMLIEVERRFWHDHVLANEPPEVDSHGATTNILKKLHPDDSGAIIQLPDEAQQWAEKRLEAIEAVKEAESERDMFSNRIKAAIGDATVGELPDGTGFSWRTIERAAHEVKASKSRTLRFHKSSKSMATAKAKAEMRLAELEKGIL